MIRLISFCCQGIARLKPGVTLTQANADVTRMLALAPAKFAVNPGFSANVWATPASPPLAFAQGRPGWRYRKDALDADGHSGHCAADRLRQRGESALVRADGRRQELAVRAALGAGWGRIARELLLESLLLGVASGVLGLALAYAALRVLAASRMENLPRIHDISIDPVVVAFTLGISLASGFAFRPDPSLQVCAAAVIQRAW